MDKKYTNEDFLVRWISGELSEEELAEFESSEVYRQIMAIDNEAKALEGPLVDTDIALKKVTERIHQSKKEVPVRPLWKLIAVAASIAILFGAFNYFLGSTTYSTGIGEKDIILLADGSTIEMNANSKLSYKRFGWLDNRKVTFEGEAFFDVAPGDFSVETKKGTIHVLGTKFNIKDRKNIKVQCYEGSIAFVPFNKNLPSIDLSKGMELELTDKKTIQRKFVNTVPDWKNGFSLFSARPFSEVMEELTIQYPIDFQIDSIQTDRLFSGKFPHNNLESALKATMDPMGIKYHISEDKRIVTLSR